MTKVLIDCDPGIDDAMALALAAGATGLDLVAITTVGGNVDLALTTANALALREFLGLGDIPVTPGSAGALMHRTVRAGDVHGDTGLGGAVLPPPLLAVAEGHAVDCIIDTLRAAPGEITLVAIGPLTNLALAVRREPRVVEWARDLVIMGGSFTRGNHNPAAEFNILADPEAAAIVFEAGWTVKMLGLDVTLTATVTTAVLDRMRPLGRLAELLVPAAQFYGKVTGRRRPGHPRRLRGGVRAGPVPGHDGARGGERGDRRGQYTAGMTVVDFQLRTRGPTRWWPPRWRWRGSGIRVLEAYGRLASG